MNEPSNNKPDPQKTPPSGTGFKLWWIYIPALLLLWLYPLLNNYSSEEITWQKFEKDMISRKAVEKIVIVNNERAEIYIKKEMANDSLFSKTLKTSSGKGIRPGPHYFMNIGSV